MPFGNPCLTVGAQNRATTVREWWPAIVRHHAVGDLEASLTSGARCVSDYARDTLFEALNAWKISTSPGALETHVSQLIFNL
jgi:hypothetical protein